VAIIGFFSGPVLGMFLLGILTTRVNSLGAILGAVAGFVTSLVLWPHVLFVWYAVVGCLPTVLFGYALSLIPIGREDHDIRPMTIWGRKRVSTLPAAAPAVSILSPPSDL
jgi:Na+/proline symporter